MFQIDQSSTYKFPVNITMLGENGKTKKMHFTAEFNRLLQSDIGRLAASVAAGEIADNDVIDEILVGWEGIKDAEGVDVEFNETNKRIVCDIYPVRPRIVEAWGESLQEVARKN